MGQKRRPRISLVKTQLSLEQASLLLRALLILAVVVSAVAVALISLYLQSLAPRGAGLSYAMFSYDNEIVGISLVGAILPLLVTAIAVLSIFYLSWPFALPSGVFGRSFWLSIGLVAVASALVFTASSSLYGGSALPRTWAESAVFVGAGGGAVYAWTKGRTNNLGMTAIECYVMGTLGTIASDVIRTASGLVSVPGGAAIWGGGGLLDFVFWSGIYLALGATIFGGLSKAFVKVTRTTWTFRVRATLDSSLKP